MGHGAWRMEHACMQQYPGVLELRSGVCDPWQPWVPLRYVLQRRLLPTVSCYTFSPFVLSFLPVFSPLVSIQFHLCRHLFLSCVLVARSQSLLCLLVLRCVCLASLWSSSVSLCLSRLVVLSANRTEFLSRVVLCPSQDNVSKIVSCQYSNDPHFLSCVSLVLSLSDGVYNGFLVCYPCLLLCLFLSCRCVPLLLLLSMVPLVCCHCCGPVWLCSLLSPVRLSLY